MSFKNCFIFFLLLSFTSCGVKSRPVSPPETAIDSYIKSYTDPVEKSQTSPKPAPVKK